MDDLCMAKTPWQSELNPLFENIGIHRYGVPIEFKAKTKLPHTLLKIGESGTGDDSKSSFNKTPDSKELEKYIRPTKRMSDSFLAFDFKLGLKSGFTLFEHNLDRIKIGRKYAELFVDRFVTGNGETWHDDGTLSEIMGLTPEVKTFKNRICSDLKSLMKTKFGHFWDIKLNKNSFDNISFSFKSSPTLKGLVGGTQKTVVFIEDIVYITSYRTWKANLILHIEDDFGVEESDVTNPRGASAKLAKPALADFWVLQHQRGKKPFTTVFEIPFACEGNY